MTSATGAAVVVVFSLAMRSRGTIERCVARLPTRMSRWGYSCRRLFSSSTNVFQPVQNAINESTSQGYGPFAKLCWTNFFPVGGSSFLWAPGIQHSVAGGFRRERRRFLWRRSVVRAVKWRNAGLRCLAVCRSDLGGTGARAERRSVRGRGSAALFLTGCPVLLFFCSQTLCESVEGRATP